MPITSVTSDPEALTLTVVGDYAVPVRRLWEAYADPRQIERFWGPPEWPATFTRHDMVVGGRSEYFMTGPEGERSGGHFDFVEVVEGERIVVVDGFSAEDGSDNADMPTMTMTMTFEPTGTGSRYTCVTAFPSLAVMEQLVEMGMMEGMSSAMGQIDDCLADLAAFVAGVGTEAKILTDTQVRVSRVVRGSIDQVWRAHHDAELVRQWMLGPDGWTMPVCETASAVGESYRYEWEADDGSGRFGFVGEILETTPPRRLVTTERMIGMDGPGTVNELTLRAVAGGTLIVYVITYPNSELRDQILATGMVDGMEFGYQRLEAVLA